MKIYGVFCGTKWGMTRNKRVAIAAAKRESAKGKTAALVRVLEDVPEVTAWDRPTFFACSRSVFAC